jgi:hypothetical protein
MLAFFTCFAVAFGQDASVDDIIRTGHDRWIASFRTSQPDNYDALADAENRFALAFSKRKEELIAQSPERKQLEELDIYLANLTKSACRLSDYTLHGTEFFRLYNAKAATLMVLTMEGVAAKRSAKAPLDQEAVWKSFRQTRAMHANNLTRIEAFERQSGGYSAQQHMREYEALGQMLTRVFETMAGGSRDQKSHLFATSIKLINLTIGEDPLPYPPRAIRGSYAPLAPHFR